MKIAFVYSGYLRYATSGIRVQIDLMMDFLRKRGYKIYFYPLREIRWLSAFLLISLRIIRLTLGRKFKEWLERVNPDVIVIQGIHLPEARQLAYLKKQNWKLVLVQHGFPDRLWIRPLSWLYLIAVGKRIFKKADRVVVVSGYTYKKILPLVEKSKIIIIPLGIDFGKFYPFTKEKKEEIQQYFQVKKPLILGVGRLIFLKNFEVLIKALKFVPEAQLFLVGGGFQGRKLRILVRWLGLENRVRFFNYISHQQLLELYNIAEITVLPSLAEGLGLVLIESLACGTPVIGSRLGGIVDIIEEDKNGLFLRDPSDEKELAEHINKLLKDKKLREQMSRYGIESVKKKFDKDTLLLRFEKVIRDLVSN